MLSNAGLLFIRSQQADGRLEQVLQDFYGLEVLAGFFGKFSSKNGVKQFTRRDPERTGRLSSFFELGCFFLDVFVDAMAARVPRASVLALTILRMPARSGARDLAGTGVPHCYIIATDLLPPNKIWQGVPCLGGQLTS